QPRDRVGNGPGRDEGALGGFRDISLQERSVAQVDSVGNRGVARHKPAVIADDAGRRIGPELERSPELRNQAGWDDDRGYAGDAAFALKTLGDDEARVTGDAVDQQAGDDEPPA